MRATRRTGNDATIAVSTFSITAPVITDEQDQREKESLTAAERMQIERDLRGGRRIRRRDDDDGGDDQEEDGDDQPEETDEMIRDATMQLTEVIDRMPASQKENYARALRECPRLVEIETSPLKYFRAKGFNNPDRVALAIVKYWDWRVKFFGADMLTVPLTSTPNGALRRAKNGELNSLLGERIIARLPDDNYGRPVVYVDRRKFEDNNHFKVRDPALRKEFVSSLVASMK